MWKDGARDWVSCGRMEVGTGCHVVLCLCNDVVVHVGCSSI